MIDIKKEIEKLKIEGCIDILDDGTEIYDLATTRKISTLKKLEKSQKATKIVDNSNNNFFKNKA